MQSESLTICLVASGYPPDDGGGIGTYSYNLARGLKERGHKVIVITQTLEQDSHKFHEDIEVYRFQYRYFPKLEKLLPGLKWSLFIADKIKELDNQHHFDVVEFPNWEGVGFAYLLQKGRKRVIVRMHTPYFEALAIDKKKEEISFADHFTCWLEKKSCQLSDALVSSTKTHRDLMVKTYGLKQEKITILPLGIHLVDKPNGSVSPGTKKKLKVLYVSRMERRKGTATLIDSVRRVIFDCPNATFVFIGKDRDQSPTGGNFRNYFLSKNEGLKEEVNFLGYVPHEELQQYYRNCDVFVVPSLYESFGLIYVEAMMYGKPVIGCKTGGIPEVIDEGQTGLLVEPNNSDELSKAIVHLLDHEDLRREMGQKARKACEERFSYQLMAKRTEELYQRIRK